MNNSEVTIDSVDAKLITLLLRDARTKTKDLAKACGISSTAVGNRIKKLKENGTIIGSALIINMSEIGYMHPASISIERAKEEDTKKIISLIEHSSGIFYSASTLGKCELQVFFVSKSLKDIDNLKKLIMKHVSGWVSVDLWSTPWVSFENISINGE